MKEGRAYAFLLNAFVVILEAVAFFEALSERGASVLTYYTELANALAFFASLCFCVAALVWRGGIPHPVRVLRYLSVAMLSLVVLVVLFVLSPLLGGADGARILFFDGTMFYFHLLCPALSALSFFLYEGGAPLARHHTLLALVPTVLYASVLLLLNANSVLSGPYPFFMIYDIPPILTVLIATFLLGCAFLSAHAVRRADERWGSA